MDMRKTIRKEIETCGKSRNQIAIDTGIEPAVLCRLMQGRSIKAETAETLLNYFGYELKKTKGKRG
jgi:hypothetical protein